MKHQCQRCGYATSSDALYLKHVTGRGVMPCSAPARPQPPSAAQLECEETCLYGHKLECDALIPIYTLADMIGVACMGCCPHGTRPTGLQAMQDATARRYKTMLAKRSGVRLDK